jgi:hypothetical protein
LTKKKPKSLSDMRPIILNKNDNIINRTKSTPPIKLKYNSNERRLSENTSNIRTNKNNINLNDVKNKLTNKNTTNHFNNDSNVPLNLTTTIPDTILPTSIIPDTNKQTLSSKKITIPDTNILTSLATIIPDTNLPTFSTSKTIIPDTNMPTYSAKKIIIPDTIVPTFSTSTTIIPDTSLQPLSTTIIPDTNKQTFSRIKITKLSTSSAKKTFVLKERKKISFLKFGKLLNGNNAMDKRETVSKDNYSQIIKIAFENQIFSKVFTAIEKEIIDECIYELMEIANCGLKEKEAKKSIDDAYHLNVAKNNQKSNNSNELIDQNEIFQIADTPCKLTNGSHFFNSDDFEKVKEVNEMNRTLSKTSQRAECLEASFIFDCSNNIVIDNTILQADGDDEDQKIPTTNNNIIYNTVTKEAKSFVAPMNPVSSIRKSLTFSNNSDLDSSTIPAKSSPNLLLDSMSNTNEVNNEVPPNAADILGISCINNYSSADISILQSTVQHQNDSHTKNSIQKSKMIADLSVINGPITSKKDVDHDDDKETQLLTDSTFFKIDNICSDNKGKEKSFRFVTSLIKSDLKNKFTTFAKNFKITIENDINDSTTHLIIESGKIIV